MQKILSATQIKKLDQFTISHEPIASIDLMERACIAFSSWFVRQYPTVKKVGVVCGTGNNGGDGLGIARLLAANGVTPQIWIVRGNAAEASDFKTNLGRVQGKLSVQEITSPAEPLNFQNCEVILDAIFGIGLSRSIEGIYADVIDQMNQAEAKRIAIDIPSGLMANQASSGKVLRAHQTVSFQSPKLAFLFPENYQYVGDWTILDIGLAKAYIDQLEVSNFLVDEDYVRGLLRPRLRFSHKGNYGHALLVAGSMGKMGAAILCARASLRSGVGLLTVRVPQCGNDVMQNSVPEAMTSVDENQCFFSASPTMLNYSCIGVGPGIGTNTLSVNALGALLENYRKPMVIDADALNLLSTHRELIALLPPGSILTPHPKEFERLTGSWANDFERLEKLRSFSVKTKSILVLKGAFTSISTPNGRVYFNPTGNPGMATGGSGDVLTGVLTGLVAQGYSSEEAAVLGVYIHGLSGDLAVQEASMNSIIATDLVDFLPRAFKVVQKETQAF